MVSESPNSIETVLQEQRIFKPSDEFSSKSRISSFSEYQNGMIFRVSKDWICVCLRNYTLIVQIRRDKLYASWASRASNILEYHLLIGIQIYRIWIYIRLMCFAVVYLKDRPLVLMGFID